MLLYELFHLNGLVLFIGSDVFVCLCLDYIAAPGCQEDDIHNVQSVIDSLSLDYLQISLSHITGIINVFF